MLATALASSQTMKERINVIVFDFVVQDPFWSFAGSVFRAPTDGNYLVKYRVNYSSDSIVTGVVKEGEFLEGSDAKGDRATGQVSINLLKGQRLQLATFDQKNQTYFLETAMLSVELLSAPPPFPPVIQMEPQEVVGQS
jgi:hypothetical protein